MRLLIALALFVLCASPVGAQTNGAPDRPANLMAIAYGGLVGADVGITMRCVGAGTCAEANPLLRPLQDKPVAFGFSKTAFQTAVVVGIYKWTKPRSKARYAWLGGLIAVQAGVVAWNVRQR
jgi:hypothetical protein